MWIRVQGKNEYLNVAGIDRISLITVDDFKRDYVIRATLRDGSRRVDIAAYQDEEYANEVMALFHLWLDSKGEAHYVFDFNEDWHGRLQLADRQETFIQKSMKGEKT